MGLGNQGHRHPMSPMQWEEQVETVEKGSGVDGFGQGVPSYPVPRLSYGARDWKSFSLARALGDGLGPSHPGLGLFPAAPGINSVCAGTQDMGSRGGGLERGNFYYRKARGKGEI